MLWPAIQAASECSSDSDSFDTGAVAILAPDTTDTARKAEPAVARSVSFTSYSPVDERRQ
ncbi:hypothetical protein GCM10027569_76240 [Flindersiella endophytica]